MHEIDDLSKGPTSVERINTISTWVAAACLAGLSFEGVFFFIFLVWRFGWAK